MGYLPINEHGLIGGLHTAALVGHDGRLVWLSWPRFDSPSVFAALLDDQRGGEWLLAPDEVRHAQQRYDGETAILVTSFEATGGRAELRDWMTPWDGEAPDHDLYRVLRCVAGEITARCRLAPRPDYARAAPGLERADEGVWFDAHGQRCFISSSAPWQIEGDTATFQVTLREGEEVCCAMSSGGFLPPGAAPHAATATRRFWREWIGRCTYDGPWQEAVRRSAITLKLLIHAPTGAIIAAPTTSLPEWLDAERNWDYRYTWLRDASLTLQAFYRLGYRQEARAFFRWLDERARQHQPPLQIMYGVDGEVRLDERTLDHLDGYRGVGPVRIGNAAHTQRQLDIYGAVLEAAFRYEREGDLLTVSQWRRLRDELRFVHDHWNEPDHGIWEIRGPQRHHTYSKLMCWATLDRGIRMADIQGWGYDQQAWARARDDIRASILADGWNEAAGAFTMAYGSADLDASLLTLPSLGFLPNDDPRVIATVERIDERLSAGPLVYRYRMDDHLRGDEGTFLLCSFWMVDALARIGRHDDAARRFEALLGYAGPQGLLAEQVDAHTGAALGNYPQAFSHIGLINSATTLHDAAG